MTTTAAFTCPWVLVLACAASAAAQPAAIEIRGTGEHRLASGDTPDSARQLAFAEAQREAVQTAVTRLQGRADITALELNPVQLQAYTAALLEIEEDTAEATAARCRRRASPATRPAGRRRRATPDGGLAQGPGRQPGSDGGVDAQPAAASTTGGPDAAPSGRGGRRGHGHRQRTAAGRHGDPGDAVDGAGVRRDGQDGTGYRRGPRAVARRPRARQAVRGRRAGARA